MIDFRENDKNINFHVEEVKWSDVRDEVFKCNPELAEKCDGISKHGEYSLFKMHYLYGASVVNNGKFCVPTTDGQIIAIDDDRIPNFLRQKLNYSHIPLSLIMNNSNEVFIKIQNRITPLNFLNSGELFGVFEVMNLLGLLTPNSPLDMPIWSVSAGARSTFMIPGISDMIGHNRIKKKLSADITLPYSLADHWQTFVDINKHTNSNWYNTILVFSKDWFENQNTFAYINLYKYLVAQCWKQFQLLEDFTEFSLLWSFFTHTINKRNLKPRPYLIDTVKHLILIVKGSSVAFKPCLDEIALPCSLMQKIYIEDYNLKDYIPTIMQPAKFTKEDKVYYSLSFPTLLDSSPYFKNPPSIIEDQRDIKKLLEILIKTINQSKNPNLNIFMNIKFELFHSSNDPFGQIKSSKTIPESDPRFLEYNRNNREKRTFCPSSSFFNGCISISLT